MSQLEVTQSQAKIISLRKKWLKLFLLNARSLQTNRKRSQNWTVKAQLQSLKTKKVPRLAATSHLQLLARILRARLLRESSLTRTLTTEWCVEGSRKLKWSTPGPRRVIEAVMLRKVKSSSRNRPPNSNTNSQLQTRPRLINNNSSFNSINNRQRPWCLASLLKSTISVLMYKVRVTMKEAGLSSTVAPQVIWLSPMVILWARSRGNPLKTFTISSLITIPRPSNSSKIAVSPKYTDRTLKTSKRCTEAKKVPTQANLKTTRIASNSCKCKTMLVQIWISSRPTRLESVKILLSKYPDTRSHPV